MRIVVGIVTCLICSPLSAQWLNYPTAGIPRLPDGKPNLTAPAPRTADGKPDLSGIWGLACPVANAVNGTMTGPNVFCATEVSVPPEFFNFGQSIKDGLPYQPWAAEVVRKTRAAGRPDDPLSRCFPAGAVRLEVFPLFRKMIQIPGLLVILNEHNVREFLVLRRKVDHESEEKTIPMKKDFKVGDHVGWNSEAGRVRGTIKKKITSAITFKGYTVHASKEEPQYLIKSDTTDHLAMHKGSALKKLKSEQ